MKKFLSVAFVAVVFTAFFFSGGCRKEQFGNGPITFSTDTLTFDTVFATFGSTTRYFKVYNENSKAVKINDLRLMHLVGTQFRINVDGVSGDQFSEVEIPAKDSIYVFVEVTVNPNDQTTPYVIIDDVVFTMGSKTETVHLQAFGQNAHFHYGEEITASTTWTSDLPHVVITKDTVPGVYVRCGATLTINPGCKIFFAGNSALFVEGTLKAEANNWNDSIVFQGARLESYYDEKPGQWFGIVFLRNNNCVPKGFFDHCVINESSYGIYAGAGLSSDISDYLGPTKRPEVSIKNSVIKNGLYNTVYGFNAKIIAENSLFYVAGEHLVKLGLGGEYSFYHCTLFNNGSRYVAHEKEALLLSNLLADGNSNVYEEPLKTTFTNCIIYGSLQNEISFSRAQQNTNLPNFDNQFSYCLIKTKSDTLDIFSTLNDQNLFNEDPRFKELEKDNYTPSDSAGYFSPAIDYAPGGLGEDMYDRPRPVSKTTNANKFDIGAIEAPL